MELETETSQETEKKREEIKSSLANCPKKSRSTEEIAKRQAVGVDLKWGTGSSNIEQIVKKLSREAHAAKKQRSISKRCSVEAKTGNEIKSNRAKCQEIETVER